jgi:hypothetical protein
MPDRTKGAVAIVDTMARGVTGAARGAAVVTASLARHAVWYLRYRVDGNARAQSKHERARRARRG